MCQQKAFGVPRALISQFFAAVMEAIFSPHLMFWWAPPDIKVQNLSLGVNLGWNLVTMKRIPIIFLLSIDLQWPFHLMGEVHLTHPLIA